ncbi:MAG: 6-bladed beta-propeller [Gracilimonas sp.]|nr:6-bladed beta-propeller [Gracilimonas sp.]
MKVLQKPANLLSETIIDNKNNEVVFGTLSQIEIDNADRIYLGDFLQKKIHLFDKKGDYITSLGREGVGPGEFQGFSHMNITGNRLSVFDRWQFRINEFNLETLS